MKRFAVGICVIALGASCARSRPRTVITPPPQPRPAVTELRGVWVSDTPKLDWDKATADLARNGFNAMYVNLASGGAALYPGSKVVPSVGAPGDAVGRGI